MLYQLSPGLMTDSTGDFFSSDMSHLVEKGFRCESCCFLETKSVHLEEIFFLDSNKKNLVFGEIG